MNETVSTRSSRNRRVVALMGWGCLVITSFFLWNARQSGSIRAVTDEPVAFILAAFSAFVGVFAWMLYNPGRRTAAESPSLFFAALATLFPPSIIGFCLMPVDSPLRWWLALGLFLLCVVAVLSHVPDEFFGVPRGRSSYLTPMPAFDRVEGTVLDPNASWFTLEDLTKVVVDAPRPSLAPRAYLQRAESNRPAATVRAEVRQGSDVDDILGTDFDLGLLSDDFDYDDRRAPRTTVAERRSEPQHFRQPNTSVPLDRPRHVPTRTGDNVYTCVNPDSGRLRTNQRSRREATVAQTHAGFLPDRVTRHASTLQIPSRMGRGSRASLSGFAAGAASSGYHTAAASTTSLTPVQYQSAQQQSRQREDAERQAREQRDRDRERENALLRAEAEARRETEQREAQRREEARRLADADAEANAQAQRERERRQQQAQLQQETEERAARARREAELAQQVRDRQEQQARSERESSRRDSSAPLAQSGFNAVPVPVPFGVADTARGFLEEGTVTPQQLFGQPIQRDSSSHQTTADKAPNDRSKRRSRYDDDNTREASVAPTNASPATVQTSSLKRQQQNFERTRDEDGSELVEGVMQIHFDTGQKRANVHIPFSPPLPGMPEVDCECVGGEDLRLKVPVRQSYGIRIEARRTNADQPLDAEIGFSAVYTEG